MSTMQQPTPPSLEALAAMPPTVRARALARSLWVGAARTRRIGVGGEFRELREYRPGDPTRQIDWRASARRDRWLVREDEHVAHWRIVIWLDQSSSMRYPPDTPWSKDVAAATVAGAAALAALWQGHTVALWMGTEHGRPPRGGETGERLLLNQLDGIGGTASAAAASSWPEDIPAMLRVADMVWLVGDLLDPPWPTDLFPALGVAAQRGRTVRALRIAHRDEETFDLRGPTLFEPLEGNDSTRRLQPETVRAAYLEAYATHQRDLAIAAERAGVTLGRYRTDHDPHTATRFLAEGMPA